jgi:hypothetical protein
VLELARIQGARWPAADGYVNGWITALESGAPELALHGCRTLAKGSRAVVEPISYM